MATTSKMLQECLIAVSLLLFILTFEGKSGAQITQFPTINKVEKWARDLSNSLDILVRKDSGYNILLQKFNNGNRDIDWSKVNFKPFEGEKLLMGMADSIGGLLAKSIVALNRSVQAAEIAAASYQWNKKLKVDDVDYIDTSNPPVNLTLTMNPKFKQAVSLNVTSVHIPVEIYKGNEDILNGLKWSEALDEAFKLNYDLDPDLLWQYFGSQSGFMRTFPANRWKPQDKVDLYDVRRRPWYTQGSSSPKDMLILIDTSGSVHGQALNLIKVAIDSMLDTLGENDYVNVAHFSKESKFASCFTTFVQANSRNKRYLLQQVQGLNASDMANFKIGLTFAFEQFEDFRNRTANGTGAHCNEVIMLLTDGGNDNSIDVFKKYNWPNKPVRVFTYAVGTTANPIAAIKWMACANRGFYSHIPAMGAIRSKVQAYTSVLARPLAINKVERSIWSSLYTGTFADFKAEYGLVLSRPLALSQSALPLWASAYADHMNHQSILLRPFEHWVPYEVETWSHPDAWGLGMLTTVTLPVYNKTSGEFNQTILGVMGIDVMTSSMKAFSPTEQLGMQGYTFSINPNGYVVFHPLLQGQKAWKKDPPNVDFVEVEQETAEKLVLRKAMIDLPETPDSYNKMVIDSEIISLSKRFVGKQNLLYMFTRIPHSTFTLGMCVPADYKFYPDLTGLYPSILDESALISTTALLIAPWEFYTNFSKEMNGTGTVEDILVALQGNPGDYEWNEALRNHLILDANITHSLEMYWNDMFNLNAINALASFVGTTGGLTRVHPASEMDRFMDIRDTEKADYFRRALAVNTDTFTFSAPYSQNTRINASAPDIMAFKSVSIVDKNITPAVIGTVLSHDVVLEIMVDSSSGCSDPMKLVCYLLDDGGFLIATNDPDQDVEVGRFLGNQVDPEIMLILFNMSIYLRRQAYDFQAECIKDESNKTNAGVTSFRIPSINLLFDVLSVNWWTSKVAWAYVNFNIYNWLFSSSSDTVLAMEDSSEEDRRYSCIKTVTQYYFNPDVTKAFDTIYNCNNCTREFAAVRLEKSNLLLVISEPECEKCDYEHMDQEPVESDGPDLCTMEPRYRKRPTQCHNSDPSENNDKCGCSLNLPRLSVLLLMCLAALVFGQPQNVS